MSWKRQRQGPNEPSATAGDQGLTDVGSTVGGTDIEGLSASSGPAALGVRTGNAVGPGELQELIAELGGTIRGWSRRHGYADLPPYFVLQQVTTMLEAYLATQTEAK